MRNFNYNYSIPQAYPKNDESTYFHLRYSIISEEQDEEQIQLIINCEDVERYIISEIENGESEREKGAHRHVAIICKNKRRVSSLKKKLITYKYTKNQIYFKPKYLSTTLTDMITYIIKGGVHLTNWDEKVESILNEDEAKTRDALNKIEENKKKALEFREKFKHMKEGDYEWFVENYPKYMLTNDFNRGLVWCQEDAKKNLKMLKNFYVIDDPGTGKSSAVYFICNPDTFYLKSKTRDTFDGWNNFRHKDVLIDELDTVDSTACVGFIEGLNEMSTHAPFGAKFMYANRTLKIRPNRIFICANTKIEVAFGKDRHGQKIAKADLPRLQLSRRFKIVNARGFHAIFGIKMVCINEKKKANIICFDFEKIQEKSLVPQFEYFDEYLCNKFNNHFDYWLKYGEDKYIDWCAYKEGLKDAYKEEEQLISKMQNLVTEKLKLSEIEEVEVDELEDESSIADRYSNLRFSN